MGHPRRRGMHANNRIAAGSATFLAALTLMKSLARAGTSLVLEHPINSRIWHTQTHNSSSV
eukprot:1968777-Pyramimonas_sp.AAC.1